jgi:hypothetical protein
MRAVVALLAAGLMGTLSGCGNTSCASLGPATGLDGAALVVVSIYKAPASCAGNVITPADAKPIETHSGSPGAALSFSVGAGNVWVALRAYADTAGTKLIAEGCSLTTVHDNDTSCLSLPLVAVGDGGACTPLSHDDGIGQSYLDCAAVGPVSSHLAEEACTAFTSNGSDCVSLDCGGGGCDCATSSDPTWD